MIPNRRALLKAFLSIPAWARLNRVPPLPAAFVSLTGEKFFTATFTTTGSGDIARHAIFQPRPGPLSHVLTCDLPPIQEIEVTYEIVFE